MSQAPETTPGPRTNDPDTGVVRQTVEFLVLLCLCILLFRTFAAEAYIVPTGSMAPTLLGHHREVTCPNCRFRFALGLDDGASTGGPSARTAGKTTSTSAASVECNGDRVLVQKFLFDFRRPKRWEVAVFHFPGEPSQAYVKRVVGLPGETIQIVDGDVLIDGRIARKSLKEQRAMRILVYDNDHPADATSRGSRAGTRSAGPAGATSSRAAGGRTGAGSSTSRPPGTPAPLDWLDYHHWDPDRGRYWPGP